MAKQWEVEAQDLCLPWRLSWAAVVLFLLFGCFVLSAALPVRLLDPQWNLRLHGAMVNAAGFPLLGLTLLHVAAWLDPEDEQILRRRGLCARLAVLVAFGFLLLIPFQSLLLWQTQSASAMTRSAQLAREERIVLDLQRALQGADSTADLQRRLQPLKGLQLSAVDFNEPLDRLRPRLQAIAQLAQQQLSRRKQAETGIKPLQIASTGLRNSLPCLALAVGFAALAQRHHSPRPLLMEWIQSLHLRHRGPHLQRRYSRAGQTRAVTSYIEEIIAADDPKS